MRRVSWLSLVLVAIVLTGCQTAGQKFGGTPRSKFYRKIVSLSPSTSELAGMYGQVQTLVGGTSSDNYPLSITKIPHVASVKPDYEKLEIIKPDLVIYDSTLYGDADVQKIKALGAETFAIDAKTIADFETELYKFSGLVGTETNMSGYVDKIEAAKSAASGDPFNPKPKVAVVIPGHGAQTMILGSDTLQADVIKAAGGEFVGPKADRFVPASGELLISLNPDVLILPTSKQNGSADMKELLNDPKLKTLKAIREKKILPLEEDIVLRRGARVDMLISNIHRGLFIIREPAK